MEETLQHKETKQCIGVSTASTRSHNSYGTEAHYALTFKLDQLDEADQGFLLVTNKFLIMARQVIGFGIAGVMGFAVEYFTIKTAIAAGFGAITPRFISLPLAILTTYFINRYLSFAIFIRPDFKEIGMYFLGMLGGAAMNLFIYSVLVLFGQSPFFALVFATLIVAWLNFLFSRFLFQRMP